MTRLAKGCPVSETVIPGPELWSFASCHRLPFLGQTRFVALGQPEREKIKPSVLERGTEDRKTKQKKERQKYYSHDHDIPSRLAFLTRLWGPPLGALLLTACLALAEEGDNSQPRWSQFHWQR